MSKNIFFDIETNGLLDQVTKFHCGVVYNTETETSIPFTSLEGFIKYLENASKKGFNIIGHNILLYDLLALEKLSSREFEALTYKNCIDTLALSWYLYPERDSHGLEAWGEDLKIQKIAVSDWENLSIQEYIARCKRDVQITMELYKKEHSKLLELYDNNPKEVSTLSHYLSFKLDCIRYQIKNKIKIDNITLLLNYHNLTQEKDKKISDIQKYMPKKEKTTFYVRPKSIFTQKGNFTSSFLRYVGRAVKDGIEFTDKGSGKKGLKAVLHTENGNPGSSQQVKDWLYSLGWEPDYFKQNDKGEKVPQIFDDSKEFTKSVKKLIPKHPYLILLNGLNVLNHRIGILEGFLDNMDENEEIASEISGFTNTLRVRHKKPLVNLPSVLLPYGKIIRGNLVAREGNKLIGCDMSSLEDTTKQHYLYFFDPEYVNSMRTEGFDPHLDLAILAGFLTEKQAEDHKNKVADYTPIRQKAKKANYSCVYGAGPPKISDSLEIPLEEAQALHKAYWERNYAVKQVANSAKTKTLSDGSMWVFNPISRLWYSLREEKDKFSTINQSSGVFAFDLFIKNMREQGVNPIMQYHDEVLLEVPESEVENTYTKLDQAILKTNQILKLNVKLKIGYSSGDSYADVH